MFEKTVQASYECDVCGKLTLHAKQEPAHLVHGLLTCLTWLWIIEWVLESGRPRAWRCQSCGTAKEPTSPTWVESLPGGVQTVVRGRSTDDGSPPVGMRSQSQYQRDFRVALIMLVIGIGLLCLAASTYRTAVQYPAIAIGGAILACFWLCVPLWNLARLILIDSRRFALIGLTALTLTIAAAAGVSLAVGLTGAAMWAATASWIYVRISRYPGSSFDEQVHAKTRAILKMFAPSDPK